MLWKIRFKLRIEYTYLNLSFLKARHTAIQKHEKRKTAQPPNKSTTSCKQQDYLKYSKFPNQSPIVRTSHKHPPLINDGSQFLAWFYSFPLFSTVCKQPLNAWCRCDPFVHFYVLLYSQYTYQKTFNDNVMELHIRRHLETAYNKFPAKNY